MKTLQHKFRLRRSLSHTKVNTFPCQFIVFSSPLPRPMAVVIKDTRQQSADTRKKLFHFVLTLLTFGVWGLVWWWLILKEEGKEGQLFKGFDDAYWSYLIECEQPPASLHKMDFSKQQKKAVTFEA